MSTGLEVESVHQTALQALSDGRLPDAIELLQFAVDAAPANAVLHQSLGSAFQRAGRSTEALAAYRRAVFLDPKLAGSHNAIGLECMARGFPADALGAFRAAAGAEPGFVVAHYNAGLALQRLRRLDEALAALDAAIRIDPRSAEAHDARGTVLQQLGRGREARKSLERALEIRPNYAQALNNLGVLHRKEGRTAAALRCYAEAIAIKPDYPDAHWNRAVTSLLVGDFAVGWEESEWRWQVPNFPSARRNFKPLLWRGEPLDGKTILLHAEQGLGDAIQFMRYVPMVAARGGRVVFEVQRELARLAGTLAGGAEIVVRGAPLPAFDYHAPLLSLPRAFGTTLDVIPAETPYLRADPADVAVWRGHIPEGDGPRIGIVWGGSPTHVNDHNRSIDPALLAEVLGTPGAAFFSLQLGRTPPGAAMTDLAPHLRDFGDTAAALACLDLLVTVDTSVAHLAGALGTPVWVLLPKAPDWRWLLGRDDSPWYPAMRLFRQAKETDWPPVLARVARELAKLTFNDVRRSDVRAIESRQAAL